MERSVRTQSPPRSQTDLLTSDEVIDRLLMHPLLRKRASTCVLPAVRIGTEWRFRRSDLNDWIARELVPPSASA